MFQPSYCAFYLDEIHGSGGSDALKNFLSQPM
jgi:hypothetical protein